jgi:hypothetical protein
MRTLRLSTRYAIPLSTTWDGRVHVRSVAAFARRAAALAISTVRHYA